MNPDFIKEANTVNPYFIKEANTVNPYFIKEANTMNPDQTAPSLIWVHIVCNIGKEKINRQHEQMIKVVTDE